MTTLSRKTALQHQAGNAASAVLKPVYGYRGELESKGIQPKDHTRENINYLKQLERQKQQNKIQEELEANKEQFKMAQFQSAQSKVKDELNKLPEGPRHEFLRKSSSSNSNMLDLSSPPVVAHKKVKTKPRVPSISQLPTKTQPRSSKNFVSSNIEAAVQAEPPSLNLEQEQPIHKDFGKVPDYINQRKMQMAQAIEQKRQAEEAKKIPAGMKLMAEEERLETLQALHHNLQKYEIEMQRLPLVIETIGQKQRKQNLQLKIQEIEEAIKVFSRKDVYITA